MSWLNRFRTQDRPKRKLRSRSETEHALQVELAEFAPDILQFLGLVAYLKLEIYTQGTRAVVGAPTLEAKSVLAEVAAHALTEHQRFADELRRRDTDPHRAMEPFTPLIDRYLGRIESDDWHQHVLSVYLVSGLFDGFFAQLAHGLRDPFGKTASDALLDDSGRERLKDLLTQEITADPLLSNRLALWGRRLVGDTLLVARGVLRLSEHREYVESEVEPVFTELIADHIRRMDGLGLTA